MDKIYLTITGHDSGADKSYEKSKTYDEAVDKLHDFFLSYDFIVKDGKPYDEGHGEYPDPEGFKCFTSVIMHNGKVAQFTHCDGDGPVGEIEEV